MNQESKNHLETTTSEENGNEHGQDRENEATKEDEHRSLEDKLEELLKMGWTMLPESCNSPCKFILFLIIFISH